MNSKEQSSSINHGALASKEGQRIPSPDIAMRAIGRGLSLAVFFIVMLYPMLMGGDMPDSWRVACCCGGLAIATGLNGLCMRFPTLLKVERISFGVWIPTLVFIALSLWDVISAYFGVSLGVVAFVVYGFDALYSGYIVMVSARYELVFDKRTVVSRCGASFLIFGIVMVFSYFLSQFTLACLTIGCSLAIACVNSIIAGGNQSEPTSNAKRKSASSLKLHRHSLASYGITAMVLSFELLDLPKGPSDFNALIMIGIGALGAVVGCIILGRMKGDAFFLQGPVGRFTMPILIGAILLVQVLPVPYSWIALIILFIALFMRDLARVMTRVLLANEYDVSMSWLSAKTLLPWMVGLFLGSLGALSATMAVELDGYEVQLIGAVIASIAIAIAEALAPYGTDPLTMPEAINDAEIKLEPDEPKRNFWNVALADLALASGLTAREQEVLMLLSRGRSANVIAERLNISVNTAKTHIYKIYHKTNLSNQQTLIDEIEHRRKLLLKALEEPQERL